MANAGPDRAGVVRNTTVTLVGAASSSAPGTTYTWAQLDTATSAPLLSGPDKVVLTPAGTNATFTLPFFKAGMSAQPLTFELAVTSGGNTQRDKVVITPRSDTVAIVTAKWKAGDFRVVGTNSAVGSIVTLRGPVAPNGTAVIYGTATVTAADRRLSVATSTFASGMVRHRQPSRRSCSSTRTWEARQDRSPSQGDARHRWLRLVAEPQQDGGALGRMIRERGHRWRAVTSFRFPGPCPDRCWGVERGHPGGMGDLVRAPRRELDSSAVSGSAVEERLVEHETERPEGRSEPFSRLGDVGWIDRLVASEGGEVERHATQILHDAVVQVVAI